MVLRDAGAVLTGPSPVLRTLRRCRAWRRLRRTALAGNRQCNEWSGRRRLSHTTSRPESWYQDAPRSARCTEAHFWGSADNGRLGLSRPAVYADPDCSGLGLCQGTPTAVGPFAAPIRDVALGAAHSLVLLQDGSVWASGLAADGQLGHAADVRGDEATAETVDTALTHWTSGWTRMLAATHDLWREWRAERRQRRSRWAPQRIQLPGVSGRVCSVAAGAAHSVLVTDAGEVYTLGRGSSGQLGVLERCADGSRWPPSRLQQPRRVDTLADAGVHVVAAAAGNDFTLVLGRDGSVYGFGAMRFGQLGIPAGEGELLEVASGTRILPLPRRLWTLAGEPVTSIVAGPSSAAAILQRSGRALAWGHLPHGTEREPQPVPALPGRVQRIALGYAHALALVQAEGTHSTLYAWGNNENGCLGVEHADQPLPPDVVDDGSRFLLGDSNALARAVSVTVPLRNRRETFSDIAAGFKTSYAVTCNAADRSIHLYSWGCGLSGALGMGLGRRRPPTTAAEGTEPSQKPPAVLLKGTAMSPVGSVDLWQPMHAACWQLRDVPGEGVAEEGSDAARAVSCCDWSAHVVAGFQFGAVFVRRKSASVDGAE
ncbi:hypothetical protein CDCA_CDCA20G4861 [Cyanidium caldarium]|uniref:RCC1-like domain-containing protein n=1 Tax=Cyanidium caldarium TaxID=2771 RepID=A0AAV9J388_CYACA|nr:hypothetical protein CDCA_CDCA20G4861 [Cyanidium caldarium]